MLKNFLGHSRLHPHRRSLQMGRRHGHARTARKLRVRKDLLGLGYEACRQSAAHCAPGQAWLGRTRGRAERFRPA